MYRMHGAWRLTTQKSERAEIPDNRLQPQVVTMATEHTLLTLMTQYSLGGLRKQDAYWINCGTSLSVVASVFMLLTTLFQLQTYRELDNLTSEYLSNTNPERHLSIIVQCNYNPNDEYSHDRLTAVASSRWIWKGSGQNHMTPISVKDTWICGFTATWLNNMN